MLLDRTEVPAFLAEGSVKRIGGDRQVTLLPFVAASIDVRSQSSITIEQFCWTLL